MPEEKRYARYQKRCRSFIIKCTCFLLLQIMGIGGYIFIVICPTVFILVTSVKHYGPQILLLLIIPFLFALFAAIAGLSVKRYGQALLAFLTGEKAVKEGRIAQRTKNTYIVITSIPEKMKKASYPHLTRPTEFHIRRKDCERDYQVGDSIMVIYPSSHELNVYSYHQLLAVYAFSADETRLSDLPGPYEGRNRKKITAQFAVLVTLVSILLLSVLGCLVYLLLRQTVFV